DAAHYHARLHTDLQTGVVEALHALTRVLRRRTPQSPTAFDESLTLVYRILFLLFAESRALVPIHHPIYREAYTLTALCEEAMRTDSVARRATGSLGVWDALAAITSLSRTGGTVDSLHVFPFNGHLFSRRAAPSLESDRHPCRPTPRSRARDHALRHTLLALGTRNDTAGQVLLHYGDFGVEQLGAVYERVLDLDPVDVGTCAAIGDVDSTEQTDFSPSDVRRAKARRLRKQTHSATRKDTGTFYTPVALAELTIRRTLGPLVDGVSSDRILELRIVDPSMGSGAFLVAALHYLASAYEQAVLAEGRYAPLEIDETRRAAFRRTIAQRCLYGVDNNPTAVQVARLSLWLATLAHGKPLGFLDHRLRVGNSLLGTTPDMIRRPLGAQTHDLPLFDGTEDDLRLRLRHITTPLIAMAHQPDESVDIVRRKEREWQALSSETGPAAAWQRAMHVWCARWFWPEGTRPPAPAEVTATIDALVHGHNRVGGDHVERWSHTARTTAAQHGFFHWPVEFADAFYDEVGQPRPDAGFDAVLGNPPWEMVRRDARSHRRGSGRDPLVSFIRESGLFPLCRTGHVNLYQPFVDRALQLVNTRGRIGLVLPWGFAVDDGASGLRGALIDNGALDTIIGFDNARGLFPIHRGLRFAIVVTRSADSRNGPHRPTRARFGVTTADEIDAIPEPGEPEEAQALPLQLDHTTLIALGGPTRRVLDLRRSEDVAWVRHIRRFPPLGAPDGWHVKFSRELNASDDRHLLQPRTSQNRGLLIAEGKHISPFRFDTQSPTSVITADNARLRLTDRRFARARLAYRDVSGVGNTHALVAAIIPANVVTTHTLFCLRSDVPLEQQHFLCGLFNSGVLDALVRLEMGGHVTTTLVEQLPVPPWTGSALQRRIARLALQLHDHGPSHLLDLLNTSVLTLYGLITTNESIYAPNT
ncbi:MAG: N-6 DNA methylase, partial [Acidobacteria bacterium]|nr:N-6 DNA methylase [Acidobacteriota bacterium]